MNRLKRLWHLVKCIGMVIFFLVFLGYVCIAAWTGYLQDIRESDLMKKARKGW